MLSMEKLSIRWTSFQVDMLSIRCCFQYAIRTCFQYAAAFNTLSRHAFNTLLVVRSIWLRYRTALHVAIKKTKGNAGKGIPHGTPSGSPGVHLRVSCLVSRVLSCLAPPLGSMTAG